MAKKVFYSLFIILVVAPIVAYQLTVHTGNNSLSFTNLFLGTANASWWDLPDIGEVISKGLAALINNTLTLLTGFILYVCGMFFDYSVHFGVVNFADIVTTVQGTGVYGAWKILRNFFNIIVVFVLLKIAIQQILSGIDIPLFESIGTNSLKKVLMSLVIFSLLVNFSFFFSKVLIDISNIFTVQFYAATGATPKKSLSDSIANDGISSRVMQALGLQKMIGKNANDFKPNSNNAAGASTGEVYSATTDSVSGAILANVFIIITAFVLAQAAFLFMGRAVALVVLLVGSPLMFARGIIGFLDSWSSKWWRLFWEQIFIAPIFMFMLYVTLFITKGISMVINQTTSGSPSLLATVFNFGVAIGLMMAAIKIAKQFGGDLSQITTRKGSEMFGAFVGGGAGAISRRTIGRFGAHVGTTDSWLGNKLRQSAAGEGVVGSLSRSTLQLADYTSKQNFDVRNAAPKFEQFVKEKSGGKVSLDLKLGAGEQKDFLQLREQRVADEKERFAQRLARVQAGKFEGAKRTSEGKFQSLKFNQAGEMVGYGDSTLEDIFSRGANENESDFVRRLVREAKTADTRLGEIESELNAGPLPPGQRESLISERENLVKSQKAQYKNFQDSKNIEDNVKAAFEKNFAERKDKAVASYQAERTTGETARGAGRAIGAGFAALREGKSLTEIARSASTASRTETLAGKNQRTAGGDYLAADVQAKILKGYTETKAKEDKAAAQKAQREAYAKEELNKLKDIYNQNAAAHNGTADKFDKNTAAEIAETLKERVADAQTELNTLKASRRPGMTDLEQRIYDNSITQKRMEVGKLKAEERLMREAAKNKNISQEIGWEEKKEA